MPQDLLDFTTTDALEEKKKLQKHFAGNAAPGMGGGAGL